MDYRAVTDTAELRESPVALGRSRLRDLLAKGEKLVFPKADWPRPSVVIPTFNSAHYTYLALETLLASEPDLVYELIIVDNASTDETELLLARLENVRVHRNERNLGFGAACTLGAQVARGEYVCFLNSDTLLTPGWLTALVRTMERHPRCGAVGAKLVRPDGRLQEAGSIVWQDGSTSGYGRGEDPDAPEYGYVREVDYCSAACLMVRRDLFLSLGGFDERYAPAYYEDADLCLSIEQAGYSVLYQPLAVVFHMEFGSSTASRGLHLQRQNRSKFVDKWRDRLLGQLPSLPEHRLAARDRRGAGRILVVDDCVPLGSLGRGLPRTRALLETLTGLGYVVTFLPTLDTDRHEPATAELQQLGIEVLHGVANVWPRLEERAHLFDAAIVSRPHNAEALIDAIKTFNPAAGIVYDAEAVFALRDARQAAVEGKHLPTDAAELRIRAELAMAASADVVMMVSDSERRLLHEYYPDILSFIWGYPVAARENVASFDARQDLLFVGNLATAPNRDAASHLLTDVFPPLRARLNCRLLLVGGSPPPQLADLASGLSESVVLTGYVRDLSSVFDACRIFVSPHRFSAGIPLKVIEAMSHGVPCVVSALLGEQLGIEDGVEALVAEDAEDFVEKTTRLYADRELWQRVQRSALCYVKERCDPAVMQGALKKCIESAISAGQVRSGLNGLATGPQAGIAVRQADNVVMPSKYLRYQQLRVQIRELVRAALPPQATVIVVSRGDGELLKLDGRRAWHFPQIEGGVYAGQYPPGSSEAINHLEALRAKGADYLLFPSTAFWWLDHYGAFKQHLEARYRVVVRKEDTCLIFGLRASE